jgi:F5/8 type C domain.
MIKKLSIFQRGEGVCKYKGFMKMIPILSLVIVAVFVLTQVTGFAVLMEGSTNFASGKTVTITGTHSNDSANAAAMLVDGSRANSSPSDSNWAHFYRNTSRSIVVDLGSSQYLRSIKMTFYQYSSWGIYFPAQVTYSVSSDRNNWTQAGVVQTSIPTSQTGQIIQDFTINNLDYYKRYVKIDVPVDVWVYADELQVNGVPVSDVALGKSVSISGTGSSDNPNSAAMLVDGNRATTSPSDTNWARFNRNTGRTIIVDLGNVDRINNITMTFYQYVDWGIHFPTQVTYSYSTDNTNWTQAGVVPTAIPTTQTGQLIQNFTVNSLDVLARYIKVYVPVDIWVYFDELIVNGITGRDLAYGKTYTVTSGVPIASSYGSSDSLASTGKLTDGVYGSSTNYNDGQWQRYLRGLSRSVVIDLGKTDTVTKFSMGFIQNIAAGIYYPRKVTYSVSQNGTDWSDVGSVNTSISLTGTAVTTQKYILNNLKYQARYVKATFLTDISVFADEFEVDGFDGIKDGASTPGITTPPTYPNQYLQPGAASVGGAKDQILIYNGYNASDPGMGLNSASELMPYVGYMNNGNILDFMFDSVLFLPYSNAPSGGKYVCDASYPTVKTDWDYNINNLFDSTNNISALNTAAGNVKTALNQPNYKVKVTIAIPFPTPSQNDFGDINGDNVAEKLNTLSNRELVLNWYVDQVISRWNANNYSNLELTGFYWYHESVPMSISDNEMALVSDTADYVRSKGKLLEWIPNYQGAGFGEWNTSLGFDSAIMQPNYSFNSTGWPASQVAEAADIIKKFGMGIEIEIHWSAKTDASLRTKYYAYLNQGVDSGYMNDSFHAYYQNGGPGTYYDCYNSTDPVLHAIYDDTYNFIKHTYTKK